MLERLSSPIGVWQRSGHEFWDAGYQLHIPRLHEAADRSSETDEIRVPR